MWFFAFGKNIMLLHNAITLINSVFIKNQNHIYYNIFLKKGFYQLGEK